MKIAFLGSGRMSGAMVKGLLHQKIVTPSDVRCTGARDGTAEKLAAATGIKATYDPSILLAEADVVVAAFKPQQLDEVDPSVSELTDGKLLISILAGIQTGRLARVFPKVRNVVRVMPNSPGQIGAGISAFSPKTPLSDTDRQTVEAILGSLGEAIELPEEQLDAVTGLSGSGPAYVFEFIAGLCNGGVAAGLAPEVAAKLALATVAGATRLVEDSDKTPEELRDEVASPGGTTLAGLQVMDEAKFRETLRETVLAATRRSKELS